MAFTAFDRYIEQSAKWTPELRQKWVNDYVNPLIEAMRADLRQDEITKGVGESIFQIAPTPPPPSAAKSKPPSRSN